MNSNDTAYRYRNNEKELLRSIIDGSFYEDMEIYNLITTKSLQKVFRFYNQPLTDRNEPKDISVHLRATINTPNNIVFAPFKDSDKIKNIEIIISDDSVKSLNFSSCCSTDSGSVSFNTIEIVIEGENTHVILGSLSRQNSSLTTFIFRCPETSYFERSNNAFYRCHNFTTLVLDSPRILPCDALSTFEETPFWHENWSSDLKGTIYIPQELYNHLGDGSELDYKAATNWSIYDAEGNIIWMPIEGSVYEKT